MDKHLGTIQTISTISGDNICRLKGLEYKWSAEMFDDTYEELQITDTHQHTHDCVTQSNNHMESVKIGDLVQNKYSTEIYKVLNVSIFSLKLKEIDSNSDIWQAKTDFKMYKTLEQQIDELDTSNSMKSVLKNTTYGAFKSADMNEVNPQGEKKMNKIVEVYKDKKVAEINAKYDALIKVEKERVSPLAIKVAEIKQTAQDALLELYMGQFTDEEKAAKLLGLPVDTSNKELRATEHLDRLVNLYITGNSDYRAKEIEELENKRTADKKVLKALLEEVEASLDIIEGKDSVKINEVLIRYDIIDKKTLKIK